MVLQSKTFIIIVLVAVLALSCGLLIVANLKNNLTPSVNSNINAYLTDVTIRKMGRNGELKSTITSPLFEYLSIKNIVVGNKPRMLIQLINKGMANFSITAQHAVTSLNKKIIYLVGNVVIVRSKTSKLPHAILKTDSLTVNTETNRAYTKDKVEIIQPKNHTNTNGLIANLKTGLVTLLSGTSGEFNPNSNGKSF